jgi:hypothetical protein
LGLKESALIARATFTPVNGSPALPQGDSAVGYLNQSMVKAVPCPDEMHFSDLTFCRAAIIAKQHNGHAMHTRARSLGQEERIAETFPSGENKAGWRLLRVVDVFATVEDSPGSHYARAID